MLIASIIKEMRLLSRDLHGAGQGIIYYADLLKDLYQNEWMITKAAYRRKLKLLSSGNQRILLEQPNRKTSLLNKRQLSELIQQQGVTVIYTSHYLQEIEQLCDKLVLLNVKAISFIKATQQGILEEGQNYGTFLFMCLNKWWKR